MTRSSSVERKTRETEVRINLMIDSKGSHSVTTPFGFLNHMLEAFSRYSFIDLEINASGDTEVDAHHTVEDIGITLGQALDEALGDRSGIRRNGFCSYPMDESLANVAIDICGRPTLVWNVEFKAPYTGEVDAELWEEFFLAVSRNLKAAIHVNVPYGRSDHHKIEAVFKGFGRALANAVEILPRLNGDIMSTKGVL